MCHVTLGALHRLYHFIITAQGVVIISVILVKKLRINEEFTQDHK